jgi:hypothetical protein
MPRKKELSRREKADIRTLMNFVAIYCKGNHDGEKTPFLFKQLDLKDMGEKETALCKDCTKLLAYGLSMRMKCSHDPKPMCKKCETQCYHGDYRAKIREVMKFSGMHLIKHGRVDLLYHYFV